MLWFFVLIFITWDGLETQHLEGPYPTLTECQAAMRQAGGLIPEWVEKARALPCEETRVRPTAWREP